MLRRRLLLGHGRPDPPPARCAQHPGRLHRRLERPRPRTAITPVTPDGGRDRVSTRPRRPTATSWRSSSQIHDPSTLNLSGQTTSGRAIASAIFPLSPEPGDGRPRHDRGCRRLRPLAREGRHHDRACRPVLAGRGGAPGLPDQVPPTATSCPLPPCGMGACRSATKPPPSDDSGLRLRVARSFRPGYASARNATAAS